MKLRPHRPKALLTIWMTSCTLWSTAAFAVLDPSIGDVSNNLFEAVLGINSIIHVICLVTGSALILGAFFRYMNHRRNPIVAPLSSVFAFLIAGIAIILLIFIPIGNG